MTNAKGKLSGIKGEIASRFLPFLFRAAGRYAVAHVEQLAARAPVCLIGFDHYGHGAVRRSPAGQTAFELRAEGALRAWMIPNWDAVASKASHMVWADDTHKRLDAFSGGRVYANYLTVPRNASGRAMFGDGYTRLAALKKQYDPDNVLRRNANVAPEVCSRATHCSRCSAHSRRAESRRRQLASMCAGVRKRRLNCYTGLNTATASPLGECSNVTTTFMPHFTVAGSTSTRLLFTRTPSSRSTCAITSGRRPLCRG